MSARCSLVVNGKSVRISTGDTPLEAALADGMIAAPPGLMGQGSGPLPRRAQARSHRADAVKLTPPRAGLIERPETFGAPVKPAPAQKRAGTVTQITPLGPHTLEVVVTLTKRLALEPGHGVVAAFEGFEPVVLNPTLRVDGSAELNELVFHLRLTGDRTALPDAFGEEIVLDHPVKIKGPVGRGYYRPGGGRLVLVAAETGFAPIWSIARAARYIEPAREVAIHVGARDPLDLYMRPSLDWLRATGVGRLVLVADRSRQRPPDVRPGPLTAHLPSLRTTDVVHVAGDASTVGAVEVLAAAAGARCYPILLNAKP
ncbi:ferredoxin--NAD(+) reductase [Methylobacterium sp. J-090]|uniref:ferredoxin--NAD(+) reductase n=1 Tax=Methylobacterium sp. J-090 TaxID=2836666 RepID=UPI001FB8F471|nr:ferredoxin--NAD(+) reductase [Methylobacterium sp. J-090]MCJ2080831.1 ferredoxin--NAD(+) reductase [Methylobacterium sp. J-090]